MWNFEEVNAIQGLPWLPNPRDVSMDLMSRVHAPLPPPASPPEVGAKPNQVLQGELRSRGTNAGEWGRRLGAVDARL